MPVQLLFKLDEPQGSNSSRLSQISEGLWLLAPEPWGKSLACVSVCLSPEMNGEALETKSMTCQLPLGPEHRTNSSLALGTRLSSARVC